MGSGPDCGAAAVPSAPAPTGGGWDRDGSYGVLIFGTSGVVGSDRRPPRGGPRGAVALLARHVALGRSHRILRQSQRLVIIRIARSRRQQHLAAAVVVPELVLTLSLAQVLSKIGYVGLLLLIVAETVLRQYARRSCCARRLAR